MALGLVLCVALLLSLSTTSHCAAFPNEIITEFHDRYFLIRVDLSSAGDEVRFEAVDQTGVYPITPQYAANCGYFVRSDAFVLGSAELRASYFSCHTDNHDDETFTFTFNVIVTHEGKEVSQVVNETCSPSIPWSPREVTCEINYMEVSVSSDVTCPSGTKREDWNALKPDYATSDWQVIMHKGEQEMTPMNLSEAREQGYVFDFTDGRLVFRSAYGRPDSYSTEVNGVPVEVIHATLFSRLSRVVLMVDMMAACSTHEGSLDDSGYMMWVTPEAMYPGSESAKLSVGLNGVLEEEQVAEEGGFFVGKQNATVHIGIPYNTEGGYRKSVVYDDLFEFYTFHLYLEQLLVVEENPETRLRFHRTLVTPLLPTHLFSVNQTDMEERTFTVYLGGVPEDVQLTAVKMNGHALAVPHKNPSSQTITELTYPNNTHGYSLKVSFDDPVVLHQFFKDDRVLQYTLDINYTLAVLPENELLYHQASVQAIFTDVSPPVYRASCLETGIRFSVDHRPFDYMWETTIGSDRLTSELAAERGYIMSNDSQSLLLVVPVFTQGYEYEDISLKDFTGTFEVFVRDRETSEIQSASMKICHFTVPELILCSKKGWMTVMADLTQAMSGGGVPAQTSLMDNSCGPKEADGTRALFSFPLNSCGSKVKLGKENVTYENEVSFNQMYQTHQNPASIGGAGNRVIVHCTYPMAGLYRLFSVYKFESDTEGVGRIIHTKQSSAGLQSPGVKPTPPPQTKFATRKPTKMPIAYLPAAHPPARYVKINRPHKMSGSLRKGAERFSQAKWNLNQI